MTAAPPGSLPDTGADPQALIEEARRHQRRRYLVTGAATIALLAGLAGVLVSHLEPGRRSPAQPGPGVPVAPAPVSHSTAPAYYAYLDQGSLYSYTSHGRQYGASVAGRYLKVRATATGKLLATVRPPAPYNDFQLLTADAAGRTFVLGAMRYWQHNAGPSPRLVARNQRTPMRFLILRLTPAGQVRISRLALPETLAVRQAPSIALSPDGTRLAVAFDASGPAATLQVITLGTGRVRQWTAPGVSWTPLLNATGAWTADGRTLAFQQQVMVRPVKTGEPRPAPRNVTLRLLNTTAPGTSLTSTQVLRLRPPAGETVPLALTLTPDGGRLIGSVVSARAQRPVGRWTGELAEYSARTGALLSTAARWAWTWRWPSPPGRGGYPAQKVAWSTRSGGQFIVLQPRNELNVLGVAAGNSFRPAGGQVLVQQPAGYQELQYALRTSSQLAW